MKIITILMFFVHADTSIRSEVISWKINKEINEKLNSVSFNSAKSTFSKEKEEKIKEIIHSYVDIVVSKLVEVTNSVDSSFILPKMLDDAVKDIRMGQKQVPWLQEDLFNGDAKSGAYYEDAQRKFIKDITINPAPDIFQSTKLYKVAYSKEASQLQSVIDILNDEKTELYEISESPRATILKEMLTDYIGRSFLFEKITNSFDYYDFAKDKIFDLLKEKIVNGLFNLFQKDSPKPSSSALILDENSNRNNKELWLPWYQILSIVREYSPLQRQLNFKFVTDDSSRELIKRFIQETKAASSARSNQANAIAEESIDAKLKELGFIKRDLRWFQKRDVSRLTSIPNGANFSVPGAGKTTVTLAVHLLSCAESDKLLVICPKAAFTAWEEIIEACVNPEQGWPFQSEKFINLSRCEDSDIVKAFTSSANKFFYTNYKSFVSHKETFAYLISTNPTHVVLDESHRMKAGQLSQRGAALLSIANLPKRKDILSGTPMPQDSSDLQAQLDFLWPGSALGSQLQRGELPAAVINGLYTRTTKRELGLPDVHRKFVKVNMTAAQAALYGVVKNDALRQLSSFRDGRGMDIIKARRSVLRLLQLGSNPLLAVRGISEDIFLADHSLVNALVEDPTSPKMRKVNELVRENKEKNRKTVIWTIFTQNILDLEKQLADLNPVSLYGAVPSGLSTDVSTREGRLKKFHNDDSCWVMIANPAAAGEGISLHEVCHEAIYLDRSYVSTHYLQSIDRIHRLGLAPDTETNITIVQIAPPAGLGSIDFSVSRRLADKIRALEQLLNDTDLHQIALDEENAQEPVDYSVDVEDIADLINELEGKTPYNEDEGM